jgi:uncharacterized protein (TIGR03437 family)
VAGQWTSIGPQSLVGAGHELWAGRITALAVDGGNPDVVYAGASEGGVWKTTNGGTTWTPLTDNQISLSIGALAIDPQNSNIVYAGTGESNLCTDCYFGAGILKTIDGGATWTNIQGPFVDSLGRGAHIDSIAVHPQKTQILLAAINEVAPLSQGGNVAIPGGIYRSTDAGATWALAYGSGATPGGNGGSLCTPDVTCGTQVVFNPVNPAQAFAGIFGRGVFVSNDTGVTWQLANGTADNVISLTNVGRVELAIAPSNPQILYVSLAHMDPEVGTFMGAYKTTDGGQNWTRLNGLPASYCGIQCWNANVLAVDPTDPNIVFAGGLSLWRSLDGGVTWTDVGAANAVEYPHVDHHALVFATNAARFYDGSDGGVWSSANHRAAAIPWTNLNSTLVITQFYPGFSIHPGDLNFGFAGAQDNNTQRYSGSLVWQSVLGGDGGWNAIDPSASGTVYGECQNICLSKSVDGGNTWVETDFAIDPTDRTTFEAPLVMDPSDPQRLFFGTQRLWQTRDGEGSWRAISPNLTATSSAGSSERTALDNGVITRGIDNPAVLRAIAVAPSDPQTVYTGAGTGAVYVTTHVDANDPNGWLNRSQGLPPRFVNQIQVDPAASTTAYVAFSGFSGLAAGDTQGHVFRTLDGGKTWLDISANLPNAPVNDLQLDPDLRGTIYVATDVGVFVSSNAGASWSAMGTGMPRVVVMGLRVHRATRTLRAATHGRGMWDILVPLPAGMNSAPGLRSVLPGGVVAGSADVTVALTGVGFLPTTTVQWNGKTRVSTFVSSSRINATIPASDMTQLTIAPWIAVNPGPGGGSSNGLTFVVAQIPSINNNGVVNAASYAAPPMLSGGLVSLFGANLAPGPVAAPSVPLPTTLSGVQVLINNIPAPLVFVSPQQINFQLPSSATGSTAQVLVTEYGVSSSPAALPLGLLIPGVFTIDQTGTGQGAVLLANTSILAGPTSIPGAQPVAKGQAISIFCTGLGAVSNSPAAGQPAPASPLARVLNTPSVTIGSATAPLLFAGLAPGYVGLYQINVTVPDNAPPGDAVPLVVKALGRSSNTVTIAIQ